MHEANSHYTWRRGKKWAASLRRRRPRTRNSKFKYEIGHTDSSRNNYIHGERERNSQKSSDERIFST